MQEREGNVYWLNYQQGESFVKLHHVVCGECKVDAVGKTIEYGARLNWLGPYDSVGSAMDASVSIGKKLYVASCCEKRLPREGLLLVRS